MYKLIFVEKEFVFASVSNFHKNLCLENEQKIVRQMSYPPTYLYVLLHLCVFIYFGSNYRRSARPPDCPKMAQATHLIFLLPFHHKVLLLFAITAFLSRCCCLYNYHRRIAFLPLSQQICAL